METIEINQRVAIPVSELHLRFSRSGGRGGQNVNKVETRVEILFDVGRSPSLTPADREMIRHALGKSLSDDGILRIVSQESRSQWQNRLLALDRFATILRQALKPRKKRKKTGVPAGERAKRMETKMRRSAVKAMRKISPRDY